MSIEKTVLLLNTQYPWAKDVALEDIISDLTDDINIKSKSLKLMANNSTAAEKTINEIQNRFTKHIKTVMSFTKKAGVSTAVVKTAIGNNDPVATMGGLATIAGGLIAQSGASLATYTTGLHSSIGVAAKVVEASGEGAAQFGAAISMFSTLINEQEKSTRAMINYGMVASDTTLYTDMRDYFSTAGMSLNEGLKSLDDMMPIFAQLGDSNLDSFSKFVGLTTSMLAQSHQPLSRFGRTREQAMRAVADEVRILQRYNQIDQLNGIDQTKVFNRYNRSNKILTAISSLMGINRETVRSGKDEIINDIDFVTALQRNQAEVIDNIGEVGYDHLIESRATLVNGFNLTLGDDFARLTDQAITRAVRDYAFNQDFYDNVDSDLNEVLNLLGTDVRETYITMMQDLLDGNISPTQMEARKIEFFRQLRDSQDRMPITVGGQYALTNDAVIIAREVTNKSLLISDEYLDVTRDQLDALIESSDAFLDSGDQSIEAVDGMRVAFRSVVDMLTPGFATTGVAIDSFNTMIQSVSDAASGIYQSTSFATERNQMEVDIETITEDAAMAPRGTGSNDNSTRSITGLDELSRQFDSDPFGPRQAPPGGGGSGDARSNALNVGGVTLYEGGAFGVNTNDGMNPLLDISQGGESSMVRAGAQENLERLLRGPYAKLQEYYGGPVTINDAIAKHGTTREDQTPNSQHFFGNALDLGTHAMNDEDKARLVHAAMRAGFTGFGFGANILHVDLGRARSWSYGNATYGGISVLEWKRFVAGEASELIQDVPLQPLQSDFGTIVPSSEQYDEALSDRTEILNRIDELDLDIDGVADDPAYQEEFNQLLEENSQLYRKVIVPFRTANDIDSGLEFNFPEQSQEQQMHEEALIAEYMELISQLRQQAEEHNYDWQELENSQRQETRREATNGGPQ